MAGIIGHFVESFHVYGSCTTNFTTPFAPTNTFNALADGSPLCEMDRINVLDNNGGQPASIAIGFAYAFILALTLIMGCSNVYQNAYATTTKSRLHRRKADRGKAGDEDIKVGCWAGMVPLVMFVVLVAMYALLGLIIEVYRLGYSTNKGFSEEGDIPTGAPAERTSGDSSWIVFTIFSALHFLAFGFILGFKIHQGDMGHKDGSGDWKWNMTWGFFIFMSVIILIVALLYAIFSSVFVEATPLIAPTRFLMDPNNERDLDNLVVAANSEYAGQSWAKVAGDWSFFIFLALWFVYTMLMSVMTFAAAAKNFHQAKENDGVSRTVHILGVDSFLFSSVLLMLLSIVSLMALAAMGTNWANYKNDGVVNTDPNRGPTGFRTSIEPGTPAILHVSVGDLMIIYWATSTFLEIFIVIIAFYTKFWLFVTDGFEGIKGTAGSKQDYHPAGVKETLPGDDHDIEMERDYGYKPGGPKGATLFDF